jgi:hypothetical protein
LANNAQSTRLEDESLKRGQAATLTTEQPPAARFYRLDGSDSREHIAQGTAVNVSQKAEAPSGSAMLSQFTIEQQGSVLRWVDADGSVYQGTVTSPVAMGGRFNADYEYVAENDKTVKEKLAEAKDQNVNRGEALAFRVSGSNVTLRQMVIVNGRLAPATNRPQNTAIRSTRQLAQPAEQQRAAGGGLQLTPLAIEGTLQVGASNAQFFRAVRATR